MSDRARRWAERVLLLIAVVALGWYAAVSIEARHEQTVLSRELRREVAAARPPAPEALVPPANPPASPRIPPPPPRTLLGRLEVPRIHLSAIAREGVDAGTLRGSIGHIPGTALPGSTGNAGFAAHRDTFFRPLKDVRKGDTVTLTTPGGTYAYVVTGTRIVEPSDVWVLNPTAEPTLTLVTCYPFYYVGSAPHRFIVSGRLVSSPTLTAQAPSHPSS